jgi:hypothetical protein
MRQPDLARHELSFKQNEFADATLKNLSGVYSNTAIRNIHTRKVCGSCTLVPVTDVLVPKSPAP